MVAPPRTTVGDRMTTIRHHLAVGALCAPALFAPGCNGTGGSPPPGETRMCKGEERVMLDCSSEVSYQGMSGEAGVSVMNIASAQGKFAENAIRRVNDQVEQYVAAQTRSCREYNACMV